MNLMCFFRAFKTLAVEEKTMGFSCFMVLFFSLVVLVSINAIHPDLFNLQWRKDVDAFEKNELTNVQFI